MKFLKSAKAVPARRQAGEELGSHNRRSESVLREFLKSVKAAPARRQAGEELDSHNRRSESVLREFLKRRHLGDRLTLWYVAALAGILVLYGVSMSVVFFFQLRSQLERHGIEQLEILEGNFRFLPSGKLELQAADHDHVYPEPEQPRFIEVRSLEGGILYRNGLPGDRNLGGVPLEGEGVDQYSPRTVVFPDGLRVRVVSRRHPVEGKPVLIRLGLSEKPLWDTLALALMALLGGIPFALALAAAGGYYTTRKALHPIEKMSRRAREISAEQLNARLVTDNPEDELGQLAAAFNDTFAKLERSFEQLRRFTSDAAHELRTPLTAIRSVGEVGLRTADPTRYREVIESMLEEAARLGHLIDGLLIVARADAGHVQLRKSGLSPLEQAREVVSLLDVLAEEKRQTVRVDGEPELTVDADKVILRQVLINLVDNAIKYSPIGGCVDVKVHNLPGNRAAIDVSDSGVGIPEVHQSRIFDRFYRIDEARSRETGGTGLGLAIAKWGAEAHGGSLVLLSSTDGGCTFRLTLDLVRLSSSREAARGSKIQPGLNTR